jgi:uncharacterized GH25 family protein
MRLVSLWKYILMNILKTLIAAIALCSSLAANAHEFWLWSDPFFPKVGAKANLTLNVGEYFTGDLIGFATINVAAIRRYSAGKVEDLQARVLPDTVLPGLTLTFPTSGTHMVAFDSHPSQIVLPADKFTAYLHDEGLDDIIRQREASGSAALPGRERYWRCVKTLLRVGGKSDATHALHTAQRIEMVPLTDPFATVRKNTGLDFLLLFDGKPLSAALVKAWHKSNGQTLMIRSYSSADGKVHFDLPVGGGWMLSVVHMIPVTDSAEVDWDSYWGNLSFELPAKM